MPTAREIKAKEEAFRAARAARAGQPGYDSKGHAIKTGAGKAAIVERAQQSAAWQKAYQGGQAGLCWALRC